jgi:3-dehydroquinate dehydratase, type I
MNKTIKPAVVGTIVKNVTESAEQGKAVGSDIFEIRIDLLLKTNPDFEKYLKNKSADPVLYEKIKEWLGDAKKQGLPLIGTIRSKKEGGLFERSESELFDLIQKMIPDVDYIDIERKSLKKNRMKSIEIAKQMKTEVIISSHFFNETPSSEKIKNVLKKSFEYGADIAKIAVMPQTEEDVLKLYKAGLKIKGRTCLIAMGEIGKQTRIAAPLYGSVLSYGYINESAAPGQLRTDEIKEGFRILGLTN